MPVLLLFTLYLLTEIGLFVVIGGQIGALGVIALVICTALLGILVLRGKLTRSGTLLRSGAAPEALLAQGALSGLGALLLIMPGLLGDLIGLLLLLPPVQALLTARLRLRAERAGWRSTVIDGEFTVEDAETVPTGQEPADNASADTRRRLDSPSHNRR